MKPLLRPFVFIIFFLLLSCSTVFAQTFTFKEGDRVEVLFKGFWSPGTVTGFYSNAYTVRLDGAGLTVYPDEKEIRAGKDAAGNITQRAKLKYKTGDVVDADIWGKWYKGRVTGFENAKYTVRLEATGTDISKSESELRPNINENAQPVGDRGNLHFDIGEKVEVNVWGNWMRGTVVGYESNRYKVKVDGRDPRASGSDLFPEEGDVRAPLSNNNSNTRTTGADPGAPAQAMTENGDCQGNDWSAWGKFRKLEFMNLAKDHYSSGFSTSTHDLICMVKSRKVDFRLSPAELRQLNALRNSPDLIRALEQSYKPDAPEKDTKVASVKPGEYSCGLNRNGAYQLRPPFTIVSASRYRSGSSSGSYLFSSATNTITWQSGPYQQANMSARYAPDYNAITMYNDKGEQLYSCTLVK